MNETEVRQTIKPNSLDLAVYSLSVMKKDEGSINNTLTIAKNSLRKGGQLFIVLQTNWWKARESEQLADSRLAGLIECAEAVGFKQGKDIGGNHQIANHVQTHNEINIYQDEDRRFFYLMLEVV